MSLLMDALKRAELAKQKGQEGDASGLSIEPDAGQEGNGTPETLPGLTKLEDLDEQFIEHSRASQRGQAARNPDRPARGPRVGTTDFTGDRDAVRNAFAVKVNIARERQLPLLAALIGLLALGGGGLWLWLQAQPKPGLATANRDDRRDFTANRDEFAAPPPAAIVDSRTSAANLPSSPARMTEDRDDEAPPPRRMRSTPVNPVAPLPNDGSIRVTTSQAGIAPAVAEGYRLLQTGDLVAAQAAYGQALRGDPRNTDALHGLAAIALHRGQTDSADAFFRQILDVNPADAPAQAGLIGLSSQGDGVAAESRLKSLLATQGEQPAAHFALGNLYAQQQRWNEAQQAYFKAVTGDANNPDYLFNLAVSLDQIRQPRLAAQYYGQALAAAAGRPVAFDATAATRRLGELRN